MGKHALQDGPDQTEPMAKKFRQEVDISKIPIKPGRTRAYLTRTQKKKTELCRNLIYYGKCDYGANCHFAHGENELVLKPRHKNHKTKLCNEYHRGQLCSYGARCGFRHDEGKTNPKFNSRAVLLLRRKYLPVLDDNATEIGMVQDLHAGGQMDMADGWPIDINNRAETSEDWNSTKFNDSGLYSLPSESPVSDRWNDAYKVDGMDGNNESKPFTFSFDDNTPSASGVFLGATPSARSKIEAWNNCFNSDEVNWSSSEPYNRQNSSPIKTAGTYQNVWSTSNQNFSPFDVLRPAAEVTVYPTPSVGWKTPAGNSPAESDGMNWDLPHELRFPFFNNSGPAAEVQKAPAPSIDRMWKQIGAFRWPSL